MSAAPRVRRDRLREKYGLSSQGGAAASSASAPSTAAAAPTTTPAAVPVSREPADTAVLSEGELRVAATILCLDPIGPLPEPLLVVRFPLSTCNINCMCLSSRR
jgi:hypothetical protein